MALAPSSPRLPSPPPAAEIQIGRRPPSPQAAQLEHDTNSRRRIHPGTKAADMAAGPPLVPLNELDSAFQLQEHLAASHYHHVASGTRAITRSTALQLAQPPTGIDRTLWLYELCRFLISQCNSLIVGFLFDKPPCSANTCPEMRASEWQFLCAVHEQPKSCCAIDYCCHTLDWAANVVSDQKIFPSRFSVLGEAHRKNVGVKNLVNVFRRLHRIFAHAWFQHRNVFWTVEGQTGLYVFFKTVCDLYDLLPAENYKLPPEAEGLESPAVVEAEAARLPPPTILKPPHQQRGNGSDDDDGLHSVGRTNTRRHIRNSPSTGSAVTTVMETDEEETDALTNTLAGVHIPELAARRTRDEKPETAEISVMVEELTPDRAEAPVATKEVRGFAAEEASDEGQVVVTGEQNAKGRDTTEIDQTCSWTRGLAAADGAPSRAPEPEPASEHAPATAGAEEQCAEATETSAPVEPGQDSGGTLAASRTEERAANS